MTEKVTTFPALNGELTESFRKLKRAMDVQVAAIKRDLAQWLDQRRVPETPRRPSSPSWKLELTRFGGRFVA
jgi:hypothetical protein